MVMPLKKYNELKAAFPNLYAEFRFLTAGMTDTLITDKEAYWDDANNSIVLNMMIRGVAKNLGDHWEFVVPREWNFSNLDESKKKLFLHMNTDTILGSTVCALELAAPPEARNIAWNQSKMVVSYVLPIPSAPSSSLFWISSLVCLVLGALLLGLPAITKKWAPPPAGRANLP